MVWWLVVGAATKYQETSVCGVDMGKTWAYIERLVHGMGGRWRTGYGGVAITWRNDKVKGDLVVSGSDGGGLRGLI